MGHEYHETLNPRKFGTHLCYNIVHRKGTLHPGRGFLVYLPNVEIRERNIVLSEGHTKLTEEGYCLLEIETSDKAICHNEHTTILSCITRGTLSIHMEEVPGIEPR